MVLLTAALCWSVQALQPHVRIWDSVSLSTLQVVGLGTFERGVGSLAFSKAVSITQVHHGNCSTLVTFFVHIHTDEDVQQSHKMSFDLGKNGNCLHLPLSATTL